MADLRLLALGAGPTVAFLVGWAPWSGPAAIPPAVPEVHDVVHHVRVPCPDPVVADAVADRIELEEAVAARRQQVEARTKAFREAVLGAVPSCVDVDVLAIDCDEEPCVLLASPGGTPGWWEELRTCPSWFAVYHGARGGHFLQTFTCAGDTEPVTVQGVWAPGAPLDGFDRLAVAAHDARIDEIVQREVCDR